jgi:23S rRNA (cytosine1962-C5)-methyltransferase
MFAASQYELLDFGAGRKLERFGSVVLDRPSPAAENAKPNRPKIWRGATAKFELNGNRGGTGARGTAPQRGKWIFSDQAHGEWTVRHGKIEFELKLTAFGHVGLFPEQRDNWDWLARQCAVTRAANNSKNEAAPLRILNLFAYTGGSTLAAAAAGAEVTHVDATKTVVAWGRRNAALSGLAPAPIRWIVDDALKFARRELKRGKKYDGVILDPPSYGHGAAGETWKLEEHLPELLEVCRELTAPRARLVLLTCHAPDYDAERLAGCLANAGLAEQKRRIESGDLWLATAKGRRLHAGTFARAVGF